MAEPRRSSSRADNRYGFENEAQARTLRALSLLLDQERKRSRTIQFMPDLDDVRVEVIDVASGDYVAIVDVFDDGRMEVRLDS